MADETRHVTVVFQNGNQISFAMDAKDHDAFVGDFVNKLKDAKASYPIFDLYDGRRSNPRTLAVRLADVLYIY